MMHVDALSIAQIQQGGVFYVKMEIQCLFLKGKGQCFDYAEKEEIQIEWNNVILWLWIHRKCTHKP